LTLLRIVQVTLDRWDCSNCIFALLCRVQVGWC